MDETGLQQEEEEVIEPTAIYPPMKPWIPKIDWDNVRIIVENHG